MTCQEFYEGAIPPSRGTKVGGWAVCDVIEIVDAPAAQPFLYERQEF